MNNDDTISEAELEAWEKEQEQKQEAREEQREIELKDSLPV